MRAPQFFLISTFLFAIHVQSGMAVGWYTHTCENEEKSQEEICPEIMKCLEKNKDKIDESNFAGLCENQFKECAAAFQKTKKCQRELIPSKKK